MSIAVYKKAIPASQRVTHHPHVSMKRKHRNRYMQLLPAVLVTTGSVLIANVLWPILSFQLFVSPVIKPSSLTLPVSDDQVVQYQPAVVPVQALADERKDSEEIAPPKIIEGELDYTNLSLWFPSIRMPENEITEAKTYTISIPALKVEDAEVRIGGLSLEKNLIQYPGTANPGELGSPIIFGHSVSPIFYNPSKTNPKRYTSIFTKIMSLKKDDKIIVKYDGVTYTYRVTNKLEVKPDDTYILEQRYDVRELKLVTCTPPGTFLRRGLVFAQLEDYQ